MSYNVISIPPFDKQIKRLVKKFPSLKIDDIQTLNLYMHQTFKTLFKQKRLLQFYLKQPFLFVNSNYASFLNHDLQFPSGATGPLNN